MLIISFLLLAAAVIYATNAWFTKMVSSADMKFKVAKWDFTANQEIQDMVINIYEYGSLSGGVVAPGTAGYIPLQLSARNSNSDVDYYVTVDKSAMSDEFKQRIKLSYKDESGMHEFLNEGHDLRGTLEAGKTHTVIIYWEWLYEPLTGTGSDGKPTPAEIYAFDEYDTRVGKNPALYAKYMNATIKIAGAQVEPVTAETPPGG